MCSRREIFSWGWSGKIGKMKNDMNARKQTKAAGQTKQTKENMMENQCSSKEISSISL